MGQFGWAGDGLFCFIVAVAKYDTLLPISATAKPISMVGEMLLPELHHTHMRPSAE
jgi:hypothetical protein